MSLMKNSEFEDEQEFVPSEEEVRFIANQNIKCNSFLLSIEKCRNDILSAEIKKNPGKTSDFQFMECKRLVDKHYACMTNSKFGKVIEEIKDVDQSFMNQFFKCTFKRFEKIAKCKRYFNEAIREVYRNNTSSFN